MTALGAHRAPLQLPELLEIDALVIFLQNLFVRSTFERHPVGADLAHTDTMPPTAAVEHNAENFPLSIPLDIEREQTVSQTKQSPNAQSPHHALSGSSHNLSLQGAFRRATRNHPQIFKRADVQRL